MPKGEADYWHTLILRASVGRILSEGVKVVVTCNEQEVKPHIAYILAKQQKFGVEVEYCAGNKPCAEGNLGKIQEAIIGKSKEKILLDESDDTFRYIRPLHFGRFLQIYEQ